MEVNNTGELRYIEPKLEEEDNNLEEEPEMSIQILEKKAHEDKTNIV